jgi:hypothetical protein
MTDAPLSFEAFTAEVLEPWFADDQASYAGDSASSPKDAAARAAYQALVVHKIAPHVAPLSDEDVKRGVVPAEGLEDRS